MAQEIYKPGQQLPVEQRAQEGQILEQSINSLRDRINVVARFGANLRAGRNAANVLVEAQKEMAEIQSEVIRHHANLIARARKMDLTDRFQAGLSDLTRRVAERTNIETDHYYKLLAERLNYYEDFFGSRIRELEAKVKLGEMTEERGRIRIKQYEADRDAQQAQDRTLIAQLIEANIRVVEKALADYHPS